MYQTAFWKFRPELNKKGEMGGEKKGEMGGFPDFPIYDISPIQLKKGKWVVKRKRTKRNITAHGTIKKKLNE